MTKEHTCKVTMSFPVQDPSNPVDSAVSIASPAPVRRSLRPQVGGNRTEPIKLNAGPSNLQKCENLKYSREQLQALRPSMDNTPPSSVACYRSVVVIADDEIVNKNIGRKKFIELLIPRNCLLTKEIHLFILVIITHKIFTYFFDLD